MKWDCFFFFFFARATQLNLLPEKFCLVLGSDPSFNTVSWCHPAVSLRKGGVSVLEGLSAALIVLLTVNRMSILAAWPSSVKAVTDGSLVSADHLPSTAAAVASSITHPAPILLPLAANSCCSIVSFTLSATKLAEQRDDGRGEIEGRSSNISSMLHWSNEPWQACFDKGELTCWGQISAFCGPGTCPSITRIHLGGKENVKRTLSKPKGRAEGSVRTGASTLSSSLGLQIGRWCPEGFWSQFEL